MTPPRFPVLILLLVLALFLLPAVLIGIVTPLLTTLALARSRRTGHIVGMMHALGATGSIIGTFVAEEQIWAHLDIAGVDATEEPLPTVPKGFSGWGVRVLDEYLRRHHE